MFVIPQTEASIARAVPVIVNGTTVGNDVHCITRTLPALSLVSAYRTAFTDYTQMTAHFELALHFQVVAGASADWVNSAAE